jgi:hypothetical protein
MVQMNARPASFGTGRGGGSKFRFQAHRIGLAGRVESKFETGDTENAGIIEEI